jgi:hypothetical protein
LSIIESDGGAPHLPRSITARPPKPGVKRRAHDDIAASLRQAYDAALAEDVPSALTDLLQQLR